MTHPTYTQQALSRYTLPRLKRIAADLGVTPADNKTQRQTWVNAIITHQSAQLEKVQVHEQAPEELTIVEISFYDHEYYAGNKLIATITHDHADFVTQRWVVMVNATEVYRDATPMLCHRYICTHYKDGTLPVQEQNATDTSGITGGNWWVIQNSGEQIPCESVTEAVRLLSIAASCERLLDLPFDQLSAEEWRTLQKFESVATL